MAALAGDISGLSEVIVGALSSGKYVKMVVLKDAFEE